MNKAPQIFLSYAREDERVVNKLYQRLQDAGFKPWMDQKGIFAGQGWEHVIQKAIDASDFFLACISRNSLVEQRFLKKEIDLALKIWREKSLDDIYLIPVRLENCDLPESLRGIQWVNFFERNGWNRLIEAIQKKIEAQSKGVSGPASDLPVEKEQSIDEIFGAISTDPEATSAVIDKKYRVIKKLGEGAMGKVYLAEDIKLGRKVALKFLASKLTNNKDFEERFMREARTLARLNHPNIITVYEIGEYKKLSYIAMEYVDGQSMKDLLEKETLPIADALKIVIQICDGLSSAHREGIFHRDIKPANILLDKRRQVKIVDFGLAKLQDGVEFTQAGSTLGTPLYMSPEQIRGIGVDQRSDIFSVGVVLYEILTGKRPFDGDSPDAVYRAIRMDVPKPLVAHRKDIPDILQNIINRALSKEIKRRYQNADDYKTDLRAALDFEPKPVRKFPVVQTAVATSLFVVVLLWLWLKPSTQAPAPPKVFLSISTNPDQAKVFVDGDSIGLTPISLPVIDNRTIPIRFQKQEFFTLDTSVVTAKGVDAKFFVQLRPAAHVGISVDPPDAKVVLDGREMNSSRLTNLRLPVGSHSVSLSRQGYKALQDQFRLVQGENRRRSYSLEKITEPPPPQPVLGSVRITSKPASAKVLINGKEAGITPYVSNQMMPGNYRTLIKKDRYKDFAMPLTVRSREMASIDAMLEPLLGKLQVIIRPWGSIYVDGVLMQKDTFLRYTEDFQVGPHLLKVVHPRLGMWEKTLEIEADKLYEVNIDFNTYFSVPIRSIDKSVKTVWGKIYVDGKDTGEVTPQKVKLRAGLHTIEVRREGYFCVDGEKRINLDNDVRDPVVFTLVKITE